MYRRKNGKRKQNSNNIWFTVVVEGSKINAANLLSTTEVRKPVVARKWTGKNNSHSSTAATTNQKYIMRLLMRLLNNLYYFIIYIT